MSLGSPGRSARKFSQVLFAQRCFQVFDDVELDVASAQNVHRAIGFASVGVVVDGDFFHVRLSFLLNPPAFPEVIGYFVSECLLVFVRQAGEQAIADVVAGVLRGFVQDVAVPEDDVARFCMQFNGLNIFDQVEIFGVFSKAVVEVIGVFAKKFP